MSTIYDKKYKKKSMVSKQTTAPMENKADGTLDKQLEQPPIKQKPEEVPLNTNQSANVACPPTTNIGSTEDRNTKNPIQENLSVAENALKLVDDVVLKNYISKLDRLEVVPMETVKGMDDIILYKINKMVYDKDESAADKFFSVIGSMTPFNCTICLIVDSDGTRSDFYIGIKSHEADDSVTSYIGNTIESSLKGQFPGMDDEDLSEMLKGMDKRPQDEKILSKLCNKSNCISSFIGIPSPKNTKSEYTNATFVQGLEKFASAMYGKKYTAIILAKHNSIEDVKEIRNSYESIYTDLSAMATQQLSYSTSESMANAISRSQGYSDSTGQTLTKGTSHTSTKSKSETKTTSHTQGKSHDSILGSITKPLSQVCMAFGALATATGVGAAIGIPLMGLGAAAGVAGSRSGTRNSSDSVSNATTSTTSEADTTNESETISETHTDTFTQTDGKTATIGEQKNFTLTIQNKHIQNAMKRIDKQLERLDVCEGSGLWSTGAYFISYDSDRHTAKQASSVFQSIMQGEQSGVEVSALNTWTKDSKGFNFIRNYVASLEHPMFYYANALIKERTVLTSTASLSSKEVSMMISLPRKSVPGLPVSEHVSLAKEVVYLDGNMDSSGFNLGNIYDQGHESDIEVNLSLKSMAQHAFVTGSTGCGKSNTIYHLIDQIRNECGKPKFLIIEPAKGEYKDVFGNEHVYGTNPKLTKLLRINPFRFPSGVHVLEHIDRLVEIFNVCWPMYAAMPAVLKEATLKSYENCGWDLYNSENEYSEMLFPTFADLLDNLVEVINNSAYSEEVKSNYAGSLVTRVKSLTNGINKEIFSGCELGDKRLFDENVIVDLSRIGSQETKSLIMGILIMRLAEYRSNSNIEPNSNLRHITVLEEAHNILKRCSQEQSMEGANVAGKSVEMISNAIAEMRTYGEGFIIVDQSPNSVDISAIKNTNTKIIMRLPEENDRKSAGKSAGMKDNQIDEIAKLPTGIAIVYQNNWENPIMCKICKYDKPAIKHPIQIDEIENYTNLKTEALKLLLKGRIANPIEPNITVLKEGLGMSDLSTASKWMLYRTIKEYESASKETSLWKDSKFNVLAQLVTDITQSRQEVSKLTDTCSDWDDLTNEITKLIHRKLPECPEVLDSSISQCLMYDYALFDETHKQIYNAWLTEYKSKLI
ncbi:MAG: ATP-binding protein [Bacteroidales bacterium]|nr:ATP-binding protein [Bacteroidales bacterium]